MYSKECTAISPNIRYTKGSLLTMSLSHRNYVTFSIFPRWEQFIPTLGTIYSHIGNNHPFVNLACMLRVC